MSSEGKESAERKLAKGTRILQHRPPETEEVNPVVYEITMNLAISMRILGHGKE